MSIPSLKTHPKNLTAEQRKWLKESDSIFVAFYLAKWEKELSKK